MVTDDIMANIAAIFGKPVQDDPLDRHDDMGGEKTDRGSDQAAASQTYFEVRKTSRGPPAAWPNSKTAAAWASASVSGRRLAF